MRPSDRRRGAILPMVLVLIAVVLPLSIFLAQRVSQDLLHTRMNSRIRTASSLANNMVTDILRQFSQNYQGDHYSAAALQRTPVRYAQGFSSLTVTSDANQHYLYFQGIGGYGDDVDHPENRKVIDGVIKFVSDLTTFGTMSNGNFTTSASNVTYLGKMWLNGDWSVSGSNITVNGGPVFVDGNLSKTGGGTLTINGDLYRTGTRSGAITVTGSDYNFMPQMTWPTIDRTYYDTYANVTVTADTAIRFRYDGASSTGTVLVGTTPYAIPSSGFIIYGKNCTLTSSGTVRGKVSLVSIRTGGGVGGNIVMDSDLSYATAGSTNSANASDSFGAIASNTIAWNRTGDRELYITGTYFVDSPGTSGMSTQCAGCAGKGFHFFGTRNNQITTSGWSRTEISFDTSLDTYPPPGLPEKPYLVTWRIR